eukprot:6197579-Pleurochrysis_carterae.AAC.2
MLVPCQKSGLGGLVIIGFYQCQVRRSTSKGVLLLVPSLMPLMPRVAPVSELLASTWLLFLLLRFAGAPPELFNLDAVGRLLYDFRGKISW